LKSRANKRCKRVSTQRPRVAKFGSETRLQRWRFLCH
jgi:hypothetical protein